MPEAPIVLIAESILAARSVYAEDTGSVMIPIWVCNYVCNCVIVANLICLRNFHTYPKD